MKEVRMTNYQKKVVNKLIRSQDMIKNYLLFNGSETKEKWIPPLSYADQFSPSPVHVRMYRLCKLLAFGTLPYIKDKGKGTDLYFKKMDEFDRYILCRTDIGLLYKDGEYRSPEIPIVIPMVYTQKKYSDIHERGIAPHFILIKDGQTSKISIDLAMMHRIRCAISIIANFELLSFDDKFIDFILYGDKDSFFLYLNSKIKELMSIEFRHNIHSENIINLSLSLNYKNPISDWPIEKEKRQMEKFLKYMEEKRNNE